MNNQTPPPGKKVVLEVLRVRVQGSGSVETRTYQLLQKIGFVGLRANPDLDRHVDASAPKQGGLIRLEYTVPQVPDTPVEFSIRSLVPGADLPEHRGILSSLGEPKANGEVDLFGRDHRNLEWEFVCHPVRAES